MKQIFTLVLCFFLFQSFGQTTITTSYPAMALTFSTGVTAVTFVVRNNNTYPIVLTNISNLQGPLYSENGYKLFYSTASTGGVPITGLPFIYSTPNWTGPISSDSVFSTTVLNSFVSPFDCIGVVIPAGGLYRFALQGSKGTSVRGTTATPNIFSSGGVDLLVGNGVASAGSVGYFTWDNLGSAANYFFDGSITFAPLNTYTDIQVKDVVLPASSAICNAPNQNVSALICNKSTQTFNFATNPVNVAFSINGPNGNQSQTVNLNTGSLVPCGCINALISSIDLSASGNYLATVNATVSGATDVNLANNNFVDSVRNYKPVVSVPDDSICQYSNGAGYTGLNAGGCESIAKTFVINTLVASTSPIDGTSDATATQFAVGGLPVLPDGAVITGGRLVVNNLEGITSGTYGEEARFPIYGATTSNILVPGIAGNNLQFAVYNFEYSVNLSATQLNAMYASLGAGGTFRIGYWETFDDLVGGSDITLNAQTFPTTAKIYLNYVIQPITKWYLNSNFGSALTSNSNFNPFLTAGSGLTNTNTTGTSTYYVACSADTMCRVPVTLTIKPSPIAIQDSMTVCELISSTGTGIFDLTTMSNTISNGVPGSNVSYYQNSNLNLLISNNTNYNSGTGIIYSKVDGTNGCYASDSVLLFVAAKPEFNPSVVSSSVCSPGVSYLPNLIGSFSTVPIGTDTLYFSDAACTIPHSPTISTTGNYYMVFETNSTPACYDTAEAIITVTPSTNEIVNQITTGNYTDCTTPIACQSLVFNDGDANTYYNTVDCRRVASLTDVVDGTNLGSTEVCETIDCFTQTHNNQPYINRVYQITPSMNDSAYVCLYYLDDDFDQYNFNATIFGWPLLPTALNPSLTSNIAITRVENGPITATGSYTSASIPNSLITTTYDPGSHVWTVCFPTDSFSHFYLHSINPGNIPLPTQLEFTGKMEQGISKLNWKTYSELNNSHFILERSTDKLKFEAISGLIPSKANQGNSSITLNYNFNDNTPHLGHNYYRLKQVDIDGRITQSELVDLYYSLLGTITVYPNPTTGNLNIVIVSVKSTRMTAKLTDVTGRVVQNVEFDLQSGENNAQLNLEGLMNGNYLLEISNSTGKLFSQKISKF